MRGCVREAHCQPIRLTAVASETPLNTPWRCWRPRYLLRGEQQRAGADGVKLTGRNK